MRWTRIFARAARADLLFSFSRGPSLINKHGETVEETIDSRKFKACISTHGPEKHPWSPVPHEQMSVYVRQLRPADYMKKYEK